ncbi:phosphatidate cytidylyltransferase [Corynebacterium terpenotabidum]|uniref:Phosphatidate cytidylyltransferase n=1 Tax=Corynebacterium terpenotabidum Y-11 TaxID=1200352 RepID=S4XKC0_9CORY|nr:phosphatidate cytidylyltransferase [Corynebacterium terpenotabidum]AGP31013.1 phosphatidate cytidylyltransferase [Corynebacterium terpenotabidum Y-11]
MDSHPDTGRIRLPQPKNSAGRSLPVAISVGVGLGALVIACLVIPYAWYPLIAVAMALATWEVCRRLTENGYDVQFPVLLLAGQAMIWLGWPFGASGVVSAFAVSALVTVVARLFHHGRHRKPDNWLRDAGISVFILIWIPLCGAFATMLSVMEVDDVKGWAFIVTFMLCVVASDVGGYAAGVFFGSHPMAPAISPKKSWEGFAGSVVFAALVGMVSMVTLLKFDEPAHYVAGLCLGAGLSLCAILGDLIESQFKRELDIKDMSAMIPGHGGMMDRIDGMLPAAMLTWVVVNSLA